MGFTIRMGIPEMSALWNELQKRKATASLSKDEESLYLKWGKALAYLSDNPRYRSLQTHEIEPLSKRYGLKVWQSYLENNNPRAMRMYWVYGPGKAEITVIGLEPHPEDQKNNAYEKVKLSSLGETIT